MSKRGLLNFSIDHLTLNMRFAYDPSPEEIEKTHIFNLVKFLKYSGLNDTNTNQILGLFFEPFGEEINIYKDKQPQKHAVYAIHWGVHRVMRIEIIDSESLLKKNINYKYDFRIVFYGSLFALSRAGKINHLDFMRPFYHDLSFDFMKHSLSRIDICADIHGVSVNSIVRGITGDKKHKKTSTPFNRNPVNGEPETYYYGKKSQNTWFARIYNKKLDNKKKGKQSLYLDYLDHEKVTRLEIEAKSPVIQIYKLDFFNILDQNLLLSVFKQVLQNKYIKFKIVDFIVKELEKKGTKSFRVERQIMTYDRLSKIDVFKRFFKNAEKLIKDYDVEHSQLIEALLPLVGNNPNSKSLPSN